MNIDNINRVIAAVLAEPNHFKMVDWNTAENGSNSIEHRSTLARNNPCNTAGCLGGWMDSLGLADIADGKMEMPTSRYVSGTINPIDIAGAFISVNPRDRELDNLFRMDRLFSMSKFDRLPDEDRAKAGARALEIFRDSGGKSDWKRALEETGLLEKVRYN